MEDEQLIFAVANALGHPRPFSKAELAQLESLTVLVARNLTGLDACTGLKTLRYFSSFAESIETIRALKSLRTLKLGCIPITDLSPLLELTQLEELTVNFTCATDASPLFEMKSLRHAELIGNPWTDESFERLSKSDRFMLSPRSHWKLTRKLFDRGTQLGYGNHGDGAPALVVPQKGTFYQADYAEASPAEVEAQLTAQEGEDPEAFLEAFKMTKPSIPPLDYLVG